MIGKLYSWSIGFIPMHKPLQAVQLATLVITLLLLTIFSLEIKAQQDPHYTQYMYNMNVINPAYAGSKENLSFGLLYRKQWIEIQDAPTTFSLSGSAPVGKNVGLGLSVISDKIGPVEENNIYGDFSYTLNLGGEHKLAFGMKAGLTMHKIDFQTIYPTLPDVGDGQKPVQRRILPCCPNLW